MLICLGFYKRKPELTTAEFQQLWSVEYGSLYSKHPDITRYMRRYVQHRLSPQADFPTQFIGFDGFSESWYDNAEDRKAMQATLYYQNVLKPLTDRFLDWENSKFAAYDDQVYQVGGRPPLFGE